LSELDVLCKPTCIGSLGFSGKIFSIVITTNMTMSRRIRLYPIRRLVKAFTRIAGLKSALTVGAFGESGPSFGTPAKTNIY
jgi:hypothetical protein